MGTSSSSQDQSRTQQKKPSRTPPSAPSPPPLPSMPPIIFEDDPMLDYSPETWAASMIGTSGLLYRFSESLVYKSNVTRREASLMERAGNLTLRLVTRVISKESGFGSCGSPASHNGTGTTKAVIMEFGKRFRPSDIPPPRLRAVVVEMFMLVQTLHDKHGIVHGDIKPSNFLWGMDGRLKLADFSSARFIEEEAESWNSSYVTERYLTPERMRQREGTAVEQGGNGTERTPPPKVFDDYYALGVTLWSLFTGREPVNRQFNQRNIRRLDLVEVSDDLVRRWIWKVFKMGGCRFW